MALLSFNSAITLLNFPRNPSFLWTISPEIAHPSLSFSCCSVPVATRLRLPSFRLSAAAREVPDSVPKPDAGEEKHEDEDEDEEEEEEGKQTSEVSPKLVDEWGDEYESEPITEGTIADSDPPKNEDEWEERDGTVAGNGNSAAATQSTASPEAPNGAVDYKLQDLKRSLVDTFYGTNFGFRAGSEVRAEVAELVYQLEAANPTPAPVESPELLNGTWILLYTASSELIPLLAAGTLPLVRVDSIKQTIDTNSLTVVNLITLSNPLSTLSFSASATFEVQSPTRIQVTFKKGTLQPPKIKSRIDLPENVDIFGQRISLSSLQQTLGPLQDPIANISRIISGQPPLKIPIPGERTSSWLITTYLDEDLRISRGDGGLFILSREGSSLVLDQ